MQTVAVVVEQADDGGYGAHVPDLPGIIAAGETLDEVLQLVREAIDLYLEELARTGEPVPETFGVAYNLSLQPHAA